jgi:L-asparaginase II
MALHAKAAGWPVETYWQPDHPIQQLALDTVATLSDVPRQKVALATDGCGVVSFGIPLPGLALMFARLADPSRVPAPELRAALERIRDAMMAHPELVGGERRSMDTALMRAASGGLVAKGGAEGVQAVGIMAGDSKPAADALGVAIKIEDGDLARRARSVTTIAALRQLGVLDEATIADRLAEFASPPIVDPRGDSSGEARAAFTLG